MSWLGGFVLFAVVFCGVPVLLFGLVFFLGIILPDIVGHRSRLNSPGRDDSP